MALSILFDHRLDALADALAEQLGRHAGDPLAEDTVVVPCLGTGRWLQQRIARREGVCARLRLDFPGRYLWRTLCGLLPGLPEHSPFDAESARWVLLRLFDALPPLAELAPLARRIAGATPSDRLALAGEIATRFSRYLAWRRDWLAHWQAGRWVTGSAPLGPHEGWQRWLWGELVARLPGVSRAHPYDLFEAVMQREPERVAAAIGGHRVALFGMVELSPEQLDLFARIAGFAEVIVLAPDPCRELWSDVVDRKALARIRAQRPDVAWLYESEPAVLGNWGRAQRDFVAQLALLEERAEVQAQAPFRDEPCALDPLLEADETSLARAAADAPRLSLLQALQLAVFLRSDRPWRLVGPPADDPSLQVHASHGPVRQAEVLHDCLLECFATLPGLQPSDVLVLCADVETAADAIVAVFAGAPPQRRVPISVSGRRARTDPLLRAAVEWLQLAEQRAPLAATAEWLANPAVRAALRFDDDTVVELAAVLEGAGARWGLDAGNGPAKHHWHAAVERLVLGAAAGPGCDLVGDRTAAAGLRRIGSDVLERLLPVLDGLAALQAFGRQAQPVARWCEKLRELLDPLFGGIGSLADAYSRLLDALASIQAAADVEPAARIDAAGFRRALAEELDRGAAAALPSGAVTVCPIGGLRGLPYRVVCLFGMDETAFPRRSPRSEFDLMQLSPRFGDRIARFDDRGTFLDAVLAASDRLLVLYQGRDARDDSARNPSTLVTELIEYVDARLSEGAARFTVRTHTLHPFSPRNFSPESARGESRSHAAEWLDTARALASPLAGRPASLGPLVQPGTPDAAWAAGQAVTGAEPAIALETLRSALAEPARTWLEHAGRMRLVRDDGAIEEEEPLWTDADRDRRLVGQAAERLLAGAEPEALRRALLASPATAAGRAGEVHAEAILRDARVLLGRALDWPDADTLPPLRPSAPLEVRIALPATGTDPAGVVLARLTGIDADHRQVVVSAFPLGMHALVDAWLRHAAWVAWMLRERPGSPWAGVARTRLVAADESIVVASADPLGDLAHAVHWARRIRREPLPLMPRTTLAWARKKRRREAAHEALFGDPGGYHAGELAKAWPQALYRDAAPDLDAVLEAGERVYARILAGCGLDAAASSGGSDAEHDA
jgi:exodeoxyribonuclease V gamma subunit